MSVENKLEEQPDPAPENNEQNRHPKRIDPIYRVSSRSGSVSVFLRSIDSLPTKRTRAPSKRFQEGDYDTSETDVPIAKAKKKRKVHKVEIAMQISSSEKE